MPPVLHAARMVNSRMLDKAKRIVLSLSIIVLFVLYTFRAKHHDLQNPPPVVAHLVATGTAAVANVEPAVTPTATRPVPTAIATVPSSRAASFLSPAETAIPSTSAPTAADVGATSDTSAGAYRNGTYTGSLADANWGEVEVQVVIANGRINDVQFLEYPSDRSRSRFINARAMPQLTQEVITAQQANVDIVTGATDTSQAFIESLTAALHRASA